MLVLTLTSCMKCETWVTDMDGYRYRVWRTQKALHKYSIMPIMSIYYAKSGGEEVTMRKSEPDC